MNFEHALKIEDLGIEFQRLRSEDAEMYAANWSNGHSSHLYLVGISRSGGVWRATLGIDLRYIGGVEARTRSRCADMAVYAMRAVILRGHRKTLRTMAKNAKEAYAQCHPYEMALFAACDSDLNLAHAVEAVALRRGYTPDRLRGADFAKILELAVVSVAMSNAPQRPAPKEGGAE